MFQGQQTVQHTISDDRTRGSLFDKRGDIWVALGQREPETVIEPQTVARLSDTDSEFSSQDHDEYLRHLREIRARRAERRHNRPAPAIVEDVDEEDRVIEGSGRFAAGPREARSRGYKMNSPPPPPNHHAPLAHQSKRRFKSEVHQRSDSNTRGGVSGADSPYHPRDPPRLDRPHLCRRNERTSNISELDYERGDSSFSSDSLDVDERQPSSHLSNPLPPMINQTYSATHGSLVGATNLPQNLGYHPLLQLSATDIQRVASHLGIPKASASTLGDMQAYISDLQRHQPYTSKPRRHRSAPAPAPKKKLRGLIIHRVLHKTGGPLLYLDHPQWIEGEAWVLMGNLPVSNVRAYLSKRSDVCFITCRNYEHSSLDPEQRDATGNINVAHSSEFIIPVEKHLASAVGKFLAFSNCESKDQYSTHKTHNSQFQEFSNDWLDNRDGITLHSPYEAFYHFSNGNDMERFMEDLNSNEFPLFQRVASYVMDEYRTHFATIESLVSVGKISNAYLPFLFKPGTIVVQGRGSDARGYMCTSWLQDSSTKEQTLSLAHWSGQRSSVEEPQQLRSYTIDAWSWNLDPFFTKEYTKLEIQGIAVADCSEKDIQEMEIRPKAHVDPGTLEILRNRGKWFWNCRKQQMVAYGEIKHKDDKGKDMHQTIDQRYMIDMKTYREFHPKTEPTVSTKAAPNAIGAEAMEHDDPPDEDFVYLAPSSIRGFNLKTKKWSDLVIDQFEEVKWNTNAFKSLVFNEKTKRLIQALISNQIEAVMSTDIISGKGNGLIMLLHGGPGTGKTLTAESVAEIAQRPLYPVTCGDIGTEPNAVEKYLESVLTLGKTWGCVVLLDEADVFLEQRSLEDLHRNALVSVFLRVLEYYDGILLLTSNRVGTFDEAFRSRIQLAIHYESLTRSQRTSIWHNFFKRLEKLQEEGIDFADLQDHIEDLARHEMNGREIRNVITTARQSARWERKQSDGAAYKLNYKVMEEIIETTGKFDKYIKDLHGGLSQDQLAEDEGWRLASNKA